MGAMGAVMAKFGWCLTNHHSMCILKLPSAEVFCSCECHGGSESVETSNDK